MADWDLPEAPATRAIDVTPVLSLERVREPEAAHCCCVAADSVVLVALMAEMVGKLSSVIAYALFTAAFHCYKHSVVAIVLHLRHHMAHTRALLLHETDTQLAAGTTPIPLYRLLTLIYPAPAPAHPEATAQERDAAIAAQNNP